MTIYNRIPMLWCFVNQAPSIFALEFENELFPNYSHDLRTFISLFINGFNAFILSSYAIYYLPSRQSHAYIKWKVKWDLINL